MVIGIGAYLKKILPTKSAKLNFNAKYVALSKGLTLGLNKYVTVNPGNNGWDLRGKNKYVPIFRFCDILICFGTLSMSFRMCRLALLC
jgi:hypothetical protein